MSIVFKTPLAAACALHDCTRVASDWYVGVTSEPISRLFAEHRVDRAGGRWDWVRCATAETARDAERILLIAGYVGGLRDAPRDGVFVYVYLMTKRTSEAFCPGDDASTGPH